MKSLLLALLLWLPQAATPGQVTLQGRVVKAGTNDPISKASIVVAKVEGTLDDYRSSATDEAGRFAFSDLTPGTYRVYANRTGYLRTEYGSRNGVTTGTRVTLDNKQLRADILLTMTPYGVITGRVRDGDGKPLRDVWVRAVRPNQDFGFAQTNDLGEYRIFDLQPGRYVVSAEVEGPRVDGDSYDAPAIPVQISSSDRGYRLRTRTAGTKALADGLVSASAFDSEVSFRTYYPNTRNASDAVPVEVRGGATLPLADLILVPTKTVHVRGRVVNGVTGEAIPNLLVVIPPLGSVRGVGNGSFDIPGVPPGQYELWSDAFPLALMGLNRVEVSDTDVENVTLTLRPALTMTGLLTIDGKAPGQTATLFSVQLMNLPGHGPNCCSAVRVQPDGSFTVDRLGATDYRFRIIGRNYYVKEAKFGTADVLTTPLSISPNSAGQRFRIDLSMNTGSIEVRVLDKNQQPASNAIVALVPDAARRSRPELFVSAVTNAAGTARLEGVAPGDYKIFASENIEPREWQDPTVIRGYESLGVTVRMTEGARREVTLKLLESQP